MRCLAPSGAAVVLENCGAPFFRMFVDQKCIHRGEYNSRGKLRYLGRSKRVWDSLCFLDERNLVLRVPGALLEILRLYFEVALR